MSLKKNMLSLSILGSLVGAPACTVCDYKDAITLYPQDVITDIRFPLNKGEASTGITLSYSISEQKACELQQMYGDNYADELIIGHTRQATGERLQHKKFNALVESEEWQEKKLTEELSHYFSCFDIHILSVNLHNLRREPNCILKPSSVLAPGCYDYAGYVKERE